MQNSRSHWSHREPRNISKWLLRVMIALHVLCLLPLLTGCGSTRTVYVNIPAAPLPASLTSETPIPIIPSSLTYGASLELNVALLSALGQCNFDKTGIRNIESRRAILRSKYKYPE
ncbi:Rz1-like lysis system protein LysC [Escherichia coli]|uniref:Rz1-like lysis system protein LysC n=1 Tax=Escherichia coli TaxID=562 RepID=UPI001EC4C85E|nr:Rz1 lytic protein [Escherichia coli]